MTTMNEMINHVSEAAERAFNTFVTLGVLQDALQMFTTLEEHLQTKLWK